MNCTKCGNENREGANFCQICGQPMQSYQGPGYTNPGYYYPPYQGYPYNYPPQFVENKDTMVAILLAFILPGAGHMYAGEMKKGILILASLFILAILSALVWLAAVWSTDASGNPFPSALVFIAAIIIAVVIWLYQIYDAYQAALRFNSAHGQKRPY